VIVVVIPQSTTNVQAVSVEICPELAEPLCAELAPVWELGRPDPSATL